MLVQADPFAINYDRPRQTIPQGSNDVREREVLRRMIAAQEGEITAIDAAYVEEIEWLPTWKKPMEFVIGTEAWHVRPPTAEDFR